MRDKIARHLPLALALFAWASVYGRMLDLARLPVLRDIQIFHLPDGNEDQRRNDGEDALKTCRAGCYRSFPLRSHGRTSNAKSVTL